MWQSSSVYSSALTNEVTVQEAAESSHLPLEDSPNEGILPNSRQALICYGIPDVTSSFVTQLLPSDTLLEMNSNTQPSRLRYQRRRTYGGQRFRPYRIPNLNVFIGVHSGHCNTTNTEEVFTSADSRVESFGAITKRRGHGRCVENLLDIQQERENRSIQSEDHSLTQNRLQISASDTVTSVPSVSNQDSSSMENFPSRLQSYPSRLQPSSPSVQIDNSQNSNSPNEIYLEPASASFLNSFFKSNHAHSKEPFKSSSRRELKVINSRTKRHHHYDDDLLAPFLRLIPDIPLPSISAQKLANNLIKLSRHLKSPNLNELCCLNCCHIPILPVTGQCGHTRCMRCILLNGACPCGVNAPKTLFVNTIVREIVEKMMKYVKSTRIIDPGPLTRTPEQRTIPLIGAKPRYSVRRSLQYRSSRECMNSSHSFSRPRMPMTVQARHRRARELMCAGKFLEAAPHLARVAASTEPLARVARILLTQTISAVCARKRRTITRELCQSVREQSAHSWVSASDLECVLCTNTFTNPVSTPCGHTYCRGCIERALYYKKKCALCLGPLENFRLADTRDTIFISSILASIDVLPLPEETDVIPVVTCYVAFPGMPCPLFIFDPRYWLMVRRVLESGSRRFGMLAYERGHTFADYGTVLEICDCVVLEDSRCIVSTVGISRFRVLERRVKDGCDVARIQPLTDITPTEDEIQDLHILSAQISCKALTWLKNMDEGVREEIETAFGSLPYDETPDLWWKTPDGPNWLWWLIAILPLKSEIKILILSTRSLLKRMLAVSRTLDVMDSDSFTQTNQSDEPLNELTNQEWLNRNR